MAESLPPRVTRYIWLSAIPALGVVCLCIIADPRPSVAAPWLAYPLLVAIGWAGEEYRVVTRQGALHTLTAVIHLPLILLFTPLEAVALCSVSSICAHLRRRRPLPRLAYNAIVRVIGVGVPALVLVLWRGLDPSFHAPDLGRTFLSDDVLLGYVAHGRLSSWLYYLFSAELMLGCALAAAIYIAVESALISAVIAIQRRSSLPAVFHSNVRVVLMPEVTKCVIGIVAACVYALNPIFVVCVALPVAMTHATTRRIFSLERETIAAVTELASAIDRRDRYTAAHSERVSALATRLAKRLGLPQQQVEEITLAGLVHDLGKIGIPGEILLKNGKLTPEEMAIMQTHPRVGVDILQKYHNFRQTLPFVLHHHERYDGKGYPDGLAGEAIPLGAHILAHADAYDAMTSDRPYRKGLSPMVAVQLVSKASGTQFDPIIAGVFVAMMCEELAAQGCELPEVGGSLAEHGATPLRPAAGERDNVRYLRP